VQKREVAHRIAIGVFIVLCLAALYLILMPVQHGHRPV
jgi:hypothetical protein